LIVVKISQNKSEARAFPALIFYCEVEVYCNMSIKICSIFFLKQAKVVPQTDEKWQHLRFKWIVESRKYLETYV